MPAPNEAFHAGRASAPGPQQAPVPTGPVELALTNAVRTHLENRSFADLIARLRD